ncbi:hypothetical protein [Enterococcus faecium]|uniref:hypothetical protein n=1 Tax=Enterococcus faecium TaxID=1352 RepID=UPI001E63A485|nr:hypothetical protein [Enterococcus faecium]
MNNTLKEEQTTNKNYRSKTLKDIENEIKKQRAFLVPYTQERIQTTIDLQVKKLHQELLDQRNKEQKKVLIQRSLDFLAPLLLSPDTVRILVSMGRLKWHFIYPIYSFLLVFQEVFGSSIKFFKQDIH